MLLPSRSAYSLIKLKDRGRQHIDILIAILKPPWFFHGQLEKSELHVPFMGMWLFSSKKRRMGRKM